MDLASSNSLICFSNHHRSTHEPLLSAVEKHQRGCPPNVRHFSTISSSISSPTVSLQSQSVIHSLLCSVLILTSMYAGNCINDFGMDCGHCTLEGMPTNRAWW
ncbi:hypothetical protein U9M48_027638 [Paspalum notatum var. saurae]|uniref:Uncharacterized protein n=1 Tax=Paspalum notatum var. saurae TaxID=547442 RepID=A0AAQ3TWU8_PASNO